MSRCPGGLASPKARSARIPRDWSERLIQLPSASPLLIEPNILHAPPVKKAVDHNRQSLELGLPAGREAIVKKDRPRAVLLQFLVDVPNDMPTLLLICFRMIADRTAYR